MDYNLRDKLEIVVDALSIECWSAFEKQEIIDKMARVVLQRVCLQLGDELGTHDIPERDDLRLSDPITLEKRFPNITDILDKEVSEIKSELMKTIV